LEYLRKDNEPSPEDVHHLFYDTDITQIPVGFKQPNKSFLSE